MAEQITDEMIEYVGRLAKLALTEAEKELAKEDLNRMLEYFDQLSELDTSGVEPLSHTFAAVNVFREDIITNEDNREAILKLAPCTREGQYQVPKTVE